MPAAWSTTQEAINKLWYNITVNFDIPATNTAIGVPAGHGARIDIQARSGSVQGAAWSAMNGNGSTAQTLTPFSPYTTTNALSQTYTIPIDGSPAIDTNPYLRFQITFNSGVVAPSPTVNTGTVTPVIKDVIVRFFNPNDNFYWSQERDLGSGASAFGIFNATATAAGSTISYSFRAASTETVLHTTAWTAVTSGSIPGVAFGRYIQWAAQIQPAASQATEPATYPYIDAVSFNYTIGSELTAGPVASTWVDKRYWFFCQERNQTFNNRAWCLDSNLAWSKHNNLNASCAAVYKNFMLFGVQRAPTATSNLTSGRVGIFDRSNDDDGVKVPWVLKTKEYPSQDLRAPVTIRAVDILGRAMSAVSTPGIAVGLGGFGYTVAAASWNVAAVSSGFTYSTQVMNMGGSGQEAGHANFPANRWGSTVGLIISGDKPASRAQIGRIQISTMRKEPQVR